MSDEHGLILNNKSHKMERFLEVCLLLLLYNDVGYGYGLVEELSYFGFSEEELNVSTLYRTLRNMEKEKLVESFWEEGGQGPKRRVYRISEYGKAELDQRIRIMRMRKARIERLIGRYAELGIEKMEDNE
jgi:DNA-binding PadR family transcriptional regulator